MPKPPLWKPTLYLGFASRHIKDGDDLPWYNLRKKKKKNTKYNQFPFPLSRFLLKTTQKFSPSQTSHEAPWNLTSVCRVPPSEQNMLMTCRYPPNKDAKRKRSNCFAGIRWLRTTGFKFGKTKTQHRTWIE